jgi:hypothetical protein
VGGIKSQPLNIFLTPAGAVQRAKENRMDGHSMDSLMQQQQQQQWRLLRYWWFYYQRSKENQVFVRQIQKFYTPKTIQSCGTSFHFTRFGASSSCLTRLGAGSQKLGWLLVMT